MVVSLVEKEKVIDKASQSDFCSLENKRHPLSRVPFILN